MKVKPTVTNCYLKDSFVDWFHIDFNIYYNDVVFSFINMSSCYDYMITVFLFYQIILSK